MRDKNWPNTSQVVQKLLVNCLLNVISLKKKKSIAGVYQAIGARRLPFIIIVIVGRAGVIIFVIGKKLIYDA